MKGVTAVRVISKPGTKIQWAGTEVAIVAAANETVAHNASSQQGRLRSASARCTRRRSREGRQPRATTGEKITGDPDEVFKRADLVISEGEYGIPTITHCPSNPTVKP